MFKILCVLVVLAAVALAHGPPNPEKMKADMTAAGVSAAGISTISTFMASNKPGPGTKAAFDTMLASLTEADRTAFQKLKKGGHGGPGASGAGTGTGAAGGQAQG